MYIEEIKLEQIKIKSFTVENIELVKDFICDNEYIDNYIHHKAINDIDNKTYLFSYNNIILGFFSISSKGISILNNPKKPFNLPAVEISYFALNKQFHHMYWDKQSEDELDKFYLSDILLNMVLKYIKDNITSKIGVRFITLYSVPRAEELYRRNDFLSFEPIMCAENKSYLEDCIPLYIKINNI